MLGVPPSRIRIITHGMGSRYCPYLYLVVNHYRGAGGHCMSPSNVRDHDPHEHVMTSVGALETVLYGSVQEWLQRVRDERGTERMATDEIQVFAMPTDKTDEHRK